MGLEDTFDLIDSHGHAQTPDESGLIIMPHSVNARPHFSMYLLTYSLTNPFS